jgi:hypothetical protein
MEVELRGAPTGSSRFAEYFAPPPSYSGGESYEMRNLPPHSTGATDQEAPTAPAAAQEEPFNISFFAPRKNMRRYFIALIIILILTIAGLTALSGILAHRLNTQPKPQNNIVTSTTTHVITQTEQVVFTTIHSTPTLTQSSGASATGLEPSRPTASPTLDAALKQPVRQ